MLTTTLPRDINRVPTNQLHSAIANCKCISRYQICCISNHADEDYYIEIPIVISTACWFRLLFSNHDMIGLDSCFQKMKLNRRFRRNAYWKLELLFGSFRETVGDLFPLMSL